jgi:hypothetical protein
MAQINGSSSRMASLAPTQKVTSATVASALSGVFVWAANSWFNAKIPAEVAVMITTIFTFLAGYFIPPGRDEQIILPGGPASQ